jgi:DNA adenine methylase
MKYVGGKHLQAKYYVPIINILLEEFGDSPTTYIEPFIGGGNIFAKVGAENKNLVQRIGMDIDCDLIALWEYLRDNPEAPDIIPIDRETYYDVKANPASYEPYFRAYVSIACSYRAKKWGGFARDTTDRKTNKTRQYTSEGISRIKKDAALLKPNDTFYCLDYLEIKSESLTNNTVMYCDPPYANTTGYREGSFNHEEFWTWVVSLKQAKPEAKILVSEFTIPENIPHTVLFEKEKDIALIQGSRQVTEYLVEIEA